MRLCSRCKALSARLALAAGLAMMVAAVPQEQAMSTDDEPDAVRRGQLVHLVRQDCGSCHGMTLKGGLGRPLRPADIEGWSVEALAAVILDGIPDTPMPPWRGLLQENEALWIARKLKEGFPE